MDVTVDQTGDAERKSKARHYPVGAIRVIPSEMIAQIDSPTCTKTANIITPCGVISRLTYNSALLW